MNCKVIIAAVLMLAIGCLAAPTKDNVAPGKNWAVLVAGSNTWGNYRHQADICHAYQVLHKNGVPDENIIVMMYDDLAENPQNPTKGKIINQPGGDDVYAGVPKDYTKDDVTPANFIKVLTGDKAGMVGVGSGRVLESGPNDNVFINFADHGGPGLIAFPNELLQASDLIAALKKMHSKNMYHQLVFYMEACESGSMFDGLLPADINIYATTAANPEESSYACYFDNERRTYLGDVYSVNWMQDSDLGKLSTETLYEQFEIVKKETNTSHVMQYGQTSINHETLNHFQSGPAKVADAKPATPLPPIVDAVDQLDVKVSALQKSIALAATREEALKYIEQLNDERTQQKRITDTYNQIVDVLGADSSAVATKAYLQKEDRPCVASAVQAFHESCFNLGQTDFALKYSNTFVNLCAKKIASEDIVSAVRRVCNWN